MNVSRNKTSETDFKPMEQCIPQETVIKDVKLAAAYVPYQKLCSLFHPLDALIYGTVFPELVSPYEGKSKQVKMLKQEHKGYNYEE